MPRDIPYYLISADHPGFQSYYTPAVTYDPDSSGRPIGIWDGFGAHATAGAYACSQALENRHWLEERNAAWFIPFLERLAKGERVPIEEIQKAYFELFGKDLPCKIRTDNSR